jgi:hypothetical protein
MNTNKVSVPAINQKLSTFCIEENEANDPRQQKEFEKKIRENSIPIHSLEDSYHCDEEDPSANFYTEMVERGWDRNQLSA